MENFPSAQELLSEALKQKPRNMNDLHFLTWKLMVKYRDAYYKGRVNTFLETTSLKEPALSEVRDKMLKPLVANGIEYSNFMEEASRRISQSFQSLSGNIAELCVEVELNNIGLKSGTDYLRKKDRTDFTFYYRKDRKQIHRLEVKNVKLRERGTRGLAFDGDSMLGFFDSPGEFNAGNVKIIDDHCTKTGGYCYVPPQTLSEIETTHTRFKSNLEIAKDMKYFVDNGVMP